MLVVQNPFLEVGSKRPEHVAFLSRRKCSGGKSGDHSQAIWRSSEFIGKAITASRRKWSTSGSCQPATARLQNGADVSEIQAFSDCVRQFLIHPSPNPISVEVGWTLNDYQINVATPRRPSRI